MSKYYCEKCKSNHNLNSKIGMKHRGIKVVEKKRKNYSYILPDGQVWKRSSIYDFKYGLICYSGTCSHCNGTYSNWRWIMNDIDMNIENFKKDFENIINHQKNGNWMNYDMNTFKVVKLTIN